MSGQWTVRCENGVVIRQDPEIYGVITYTPKDPANLARVLQLVRSLQRMCRMSSWTAQVEAQSKQVFEELKTLATIG